jgi:hypothetical protein
MKKELDSNKSDKIKKELWKKLKDWLRMTKAHGPDRLIVSSNNTLRLIWLVFLIISTSLCSYLITISVTEFLKFEVKTRIKEVRITQVPFPQVSICNSNPLVTPAANDYIKDFILKNYNESVSNYSDLLVKQIENNDLIDVMSYSQYMTNDPDLNDSIKQSFGYSLKFGCLFNNIDCVIGKDVVWFFDPTYGNCYKFNPTKSANGTKREIYNSYRPNLGFVITYFLGIPDSTLSYMYENLASGLVLTIDDQQTFPLSFNGVFVKPGTSAQIVITRTETNSLPSPYGKCLNVENIDTILSREMKKLGMIYSRRNCLDICEQKCNIDDIGCNSLLLPRLFDAPLCNNLTSYRLLKGSNRFNLTMCSDLCPIECASVSIDTSISYLDFPTYNTYLWFSSLDVMADEFEGINYTFDVFKQCFAYIQVIYKEIKFTEITETPSMTWVDLVAAIGGTMGLFLGLIKCDGFCGNS